MPIYVYKCKNCGQKFEKLVGMLSKKSPILCPKCNSDDLGQIITPFRSAKSHEDIMAQMEENFSGVNMEDPKSVTKAMKEMGCALKDEEDFGKNYDLMMDKAEKEVYQSIEKNKK